jgi:hypothetical protein
MSGKAFVTAFLFFCFGFFLIALLFNKYPPAANSIWTLIVFVLYVALAVWTTRCMARK